MGMIGYWAVLVIAGILILGLIGIIPIPVESKGPYDNVCEGIRGDGTHWICSRNIDGSQHILLRSGPSELFHMVAGGDGINHVVYSCIHGIPNDFCTQEVFDGTFEVRRNKQQTEFLFK